VSRVLQKAPGTLFCGRQAAGGLAVRFARRHTAGNATFLVVELRPTGPDGGLQGIDVLMLTSSRMRTAGCIRHEHQTDLASSIHAGVRNLCGSGGYARCV